MTAMRMGHATLVLPIAVILGACSSSGKAPVLPSSSGQAAYAIHYNEELTSATKAVADAQARAKTLSSGFMAHVDELRKPDWQKVETVIDDSDEAGKSADFAEAQGEATAVRTFWDSEKNEVTGRVNGSAQHSMKQAGCSADTAGPIAFALNDAITKQLQKKLRSKNEAFVVIERYKTSLGPQNVASLEKLADEISEASYDVHVLMILQHGRVKRLADDKNDVKRTLDRFIEEETSFQNEPGRTEPEKKASQDRVTAAQKSKAEIDGVGQQAENVSKEMDKAIDASKKDYEDALKAITSKVADKKRSEPGKSEAGKPEPAKSETPRPGASAPRAAPNPEPAPAPIP